MSSGTLLKRGRPDPQQAAGRELAPADQVRDRELQLVEAGIELGERKVHRQDRGTAPFTLALP